MSVEPGSFPSVGVEPKIHTRPGSGSRSRSSISARKARRDEVRYGYDSEYRRRRHGTYGATSSTVLVPSALTPYDLVEWPCGGSKVWRWDRRKRSEWNSGEEQGERKASVGGEEKRKGRERMEERGVDRIGYGRMWARGRRRTGRRHETVGVTQKLRRSSRWARG